MATPLSVWQDSRSGPAGCLAGNLVLADLQKEIGEKVAHEKGTTFSTGSRVLVSRVCTNASYLQPSQLHFCNLSKAQHNVAKKYGKPVTYLFISVRGKIIRYWAIPARVIGRVLARLSPKPSSPSCFLRIYSRKDKAFIGSTDISKFEHSIGLSSRTASRIGKPTDSKTDKPMEAVVIVGGKKVHGTFLPRDQKKAATA